MHRTLSPLIVAALTALTVAGCRCEPPGTGRTRGEPRLLVETGGVNVESESLDFGTVPMGKRVTATIFISNAASGPLQIEAWEKVGEGPAVQLGQSLMEPNPVFGIEYEKVEISGGDTLNVTAFFEPPNDPRTQVDHEVRLVLKTSNSTKETVEFVLKGKGIRGECDLPDRIDFGAVARGDKFSYTQVLKNPRPIESQPRVDPIMSSQGDNVFTFTPDSPRGEFTVAPGREKNVTIEFSPTEARDYFATVRIRAADGCPDKNIRLVGTGVDQVLSWMPGTVNFGYVQPGLQVTQEVTFLNQSFRDVTISNLATREGSIPSNIYRVTAADMGDTTKLTVPKATRNASTNQIVAGSAKVTLAFRPTVLGPKQGSLIGTPDLTAQAMISVSLRGFGGGPDIDLSPAGTLNFGRIAWFQGANSFATRRLTVRNVGTRPTPADPAANLKLGAMGGGKPYWRVTPKNAESLASEICVGAFDAMTNTCTNDLPTVGMGAYDPSIGIEASGARASLDVPVRVTPANTTVGASGNKEWDVTIFSNDPDEPEVTVTVTARPVVLPPCNASVTPLSLAYGVVTPPNNKDLTFQICNQAPATMTSDICLITNLDLEAGTDAMFSLPAGAVAEKELAPQECMTVITRAWPQGMLPANPTNVTGAVSFNLSNPTQPQGRVQLTATLAPSCLVISPSTLDFGTVKAGCNSPARSFQLYNACPQPVRWVGSSLISAAGVPMGVGGCTSARCDEFSVATAPIVSGLPTCTVGGTTGPCLNQGGTPVTFQLRYRPLDIGADSGAYRIQVVQAGQQVDYLVTLQGRGDMDGSNTDTFRQDSRPKADILLVVDDSCSMSDKQMQLGQNFSSFIKFATTSQVDFQIGITTTDADDENACPNCVSGDLKASPAPNSTKIFTPTTPNLEMQFAATVNVGINGSAIETCMAPAVRALTAPKITDPAKNGGLLRPDAVLAVVCVTDAQDQANQPVSFYLNQLLNIKGVQRPGAFSYNVIGPFLPSSPGNCIYDGNGDDGKHVQLVSQTNGVREEICTPTWATALENVGKNAFGFRTNFYLTGTPDLLGGNVITVEIDGVNLPENDARGARVWRYDSATNAIIFEPLYVPEPGRTMTVHYKVACL
ncbi:MAG: hypothetical protein JNJ54_03000 [Myxococcaceae bacterium]|nr:hypothetical protein [Myxococcaceae bacterium]